MERVPVPVVVGRLTAFFHGDMLPRWGKCRWGWGFRLAHK